MGFLPSTLLALASLSMGELGLVLGWRMPLLVPLLALVPYLLGFLESRAGLAGRFRLASTLHRLGRLSPILLQLTAIGVCGWSLSVEEWFGADLGLTIWPRPAQLLALAPFALYTAAEIDADARANSESGPVRRSLRRFQLRMFAAGLLPVAFYVLGAAAVGEWTWLRILIEEVTLIGAGLTAALVFALVLFLPRFLSAAWDSQRLPEGPQRQLLQEVATLARFRCSELMIWRTGNLVANAAIVGLTRGSRRVFFSDALLAQLGPRQLAAVFAHEIGHARRRHVPLFLIWALGFFAGLDLAAAAVGDVGELWNGVVLGGGVLLWIVGFGWLSRRVELDADLFSLGLLRDGIGITSALLSVGRSRRDRGGWRHFSINRRIAFLGRAAIDPTVGKRLRRSLGLIWVLGLGLFLSASVVQVAGMVADFREERVVVDLRLGRYGAAAERLEGVSEPGEEVSLLVGLAGEALGEDFETREGAAATCFGRAESARASGDEEEEVAWLHLAALAGDEGALAELRERASRAPSPSEVGSE